MPRLFSALRLPAEVAMRLSLLKGGLSGARWIEPDDFHITLRFFGDVDRHLANELAYGLAGIERERFDLRLTRLDCFGGSKPHSIFASVEPSRALSELQAEHERIAQRAGLRPDSRKFTPHVTIARLRGTSEMALADYLSVRGGFTTPPFEVDAFCLMSSRDSTGGGPYVVEERHELLEPGHRSGSASYEAMMRLQAW